jgi:hypothetical protein
MQGIFFSLLHYFPPVFWYLPLKQRISLSLLHQFIALIYYTPLAVHLTLFPSLFKVSAFGFRVLSLSLSLSHTHTHQRNEVRLVDRVRLSNVYVCTRALRTLPKARILKSTLDSDLP